MASGDASGVDAMYMENLDEFINDENKVVTYRWLSTTLQVHVNQAKQMLYNFVMQQRNDNHKDDLNVTYFVAGLHKCNGSTKIQRCEVVSEDKLEAIKSTFQKLYSCHIYSVQKSKLQDVDALYITDYNLMKENIFESCKQSSIRYEAAKRVAVSKPVVQEIKKEEITPSILDDNSRQRTTLESREQTTASKNKKNNANKTSIAGMFAKASIKKESPKSSEQIQNCPKTDTKETVKKNSSVSKKPAGVMSFFANSTSKTKPSEEKPVSIKKESPDTGDKKRSDEKKKPASSDSDDDDFVKQKKKRRRIKEDLFDSSSEEEMEMEMEEPLPSPPLAAEEFEKEKDDEDDEAPIPDTPEQNTEKVEKEEPTTVTVTNDGRRRKRIKRRKKKNYLNDEGFMVTETVMESDSTDASDMDQPANKEPHPIKISAEVKKSSATAKSVVDKGKQKQSTLMSFFNKK